MPFEHIQQLNLWYLMALRDAANRDVDGACAEFGVERDVAEWLAEISLIEIQKISQTERILFRLAHDLPSLKAMRGLEGKTARVYATLSAA